MQQTRLAVPRRYWQKGSRKMPNGYPTQEEIAEFLEAKRKGGVEAIANLLREKQAQREAAKANQEQQTEKPPELLSSGVEARGEEEGRPELGKSASEHGNQPAREIQNDRDRGSIGI